MLQTGTGHFSPIGGYHAGQDMALILDVARFKYPPHWVPLPLLWEAMNTIDESTGLLRGSLLFYLLHLPLDTSIFPLTGTYAVGIAVLLSRLASLTTWIEGC
jgi:hypothetical protein